MIIRNIGIKYKIFEDIKHIDEEGEEYWLARELQIALQYKEWRNFNKVINDVIVGCRYSKINYIDHFVEVNKMITIAKGGKRKVNDYKLSRYACYLIVQNGDSNKEVVALGQTYFAVQTRRQELSDEEYNNLSDDQKRLYQTDLNKQENLLLNKELYNSYVINYDKLLILLNIPLKI